VFCTPALPAHCHLIFRRSKDLSLDLPAEILVWINDSITEGFVKSTENVFCLATGISPLVLLNPRQYGKENYGRDALIAVSSFCFL
jgi:hypothetical protein